MSHYIMPQNMTDFMDMFEYTNSVTNQVFGFGILIALYIIIASYLHFRGNDFEDSLVVAGFITSVTAGFMFLMALVSGTVLFSAIMGLVIPAIWSYLNKDY